MLLRLLLLLAFTAGMLSAQTPPPAVMADPPSDSAHPASSTEMAFPSHGENLLGIFYAAAGAGDHPTVVLLHGFPGYEQNLDLAQAIRRAGWNVLAMHYRGSWGSGGTFSLAHAIEDADTMVAFARSPENARKFHIDRNRIIVIGHSMGGYMAASATAHEPAVQGCVMIGTWDITAPVREVSGLSRDKLIEQAMKNDGSEPADFLPLQGEDRRKLAVEIVDHRTQWDLNSYAAGVGTRPVLLLTADDDSEAGSTGFEKALKAAGNSQVQKIHTATDHGFSGSRIHLETMILDWLSSLRTNATP